jgi:hypothetical protein
MLYMVIICLLFGMLAMSLMGRGLPKKYAKMGFKKGWREYKKARGGRKPRKTRRRKTSSGGSTTRRKSNIPIVPAYQIIAGGYLLNKASGGALIDLLEAMTTWILTHLSGGTYRIENYSMRDDLVTFAVRSLEAYQRASLKDTLWATGKAILIVAGYQYAGKKAKFIPKHLNVGGLFKVRLY